MAAVEEFAHSLEDATNPDPVESDNGGVGGGDSTTSSRENDDLDEWLLRGTAGRLLTHRQVLLGNSSKSQPTLLSIPHPKLGTGGRGGKRVSSLDSLPLSSADSFQIEESIEFVRTNRMDIIEETFQIAASTILQAILKNQKSSKRMRKMKNQEHDGYSSGESEDSEEEEEGGKDAGPIPNLPSSLNDRKRIAAMRAAALTRSLENKEWAKRRTVKSNAMDGVGGAGPSSWGKPPGKQRGGRKRKADSMTHDTIDTDTAANNGSRGAAAPSGGAELSSSGPNGTTTTTASAGPKFTRNTPASSAAALDHRFTNSRAILCAAGNLVMEALTPELEGHEVEHNDVPQKKTHASSLNLAAVLVDASVYARRTITIVENAVRRSDMRNRYRKENSRFNYSNRFYPNNNNGNSLKQKPSNNNNGNSLKQKPYLQLPNLFGWRENAGEDAWNDYMFDGEDIVPHRPNDMSLTEPWESFCLPRLRAIVEKGAGHVLYHDIQWFSRHGRLAHFLKNLTWPDRLGHHQQHANEENLTTTKKRRSYGPHLIITTQPDTVKFAQEFHDMRSHVPFVFVREEEEDENQLRVLVFEGTKEQRRKLRQYFSKASGVAEAPFHVIVASYTTFLEDYLHFCQMPFDIVILDDGASWMAASFGDPNSPLATVWEQGIWSRRQHTGVAGGFLVGESWDFGADEIPESLLKDACIGLTARHRILTAKHLVTETRTSVELLPISGVVSFLAPIFASVVQEEWDRSNIAKDVDSMQHFRKLVARSMVVHHESSPLRDMHEMALLGLEGQLGFPERFGDPMAPEYITDDDFVNAEKVTFSRRGCLSWLGTKSVDWLRYELGSADFQHILQAMKASSKHGHFCEEITTASSNTSSGANGQVGGTMAYRLAVCCLRHFGSEQGLRQHISAQHAPPGTWLCRTCGSDCITSQARTHHERTCGQPANGYTGDPNASVGATPTVGQGGVKGGVGKKKSQRSASTQQGGASQEEKDPNGALRVPGYRGVWVNKEGKHFIKIDKKQYTGDGDEVVLFDSNDAAARKYDELISKDANGNDKLELNFKPDGTRNIYEDGTSSTASGLGGSAANVVPLLSVINIKDLPPDVKPLLRDPRQTSRTGGNSKRHVYAYRGVCRQARKGHDRWQSQISFMGVNHYLGTFDSEWDAAAIYAWAHLILYGEEATKQAQKEGEEAAQAYEQEKRDLAAGKIPAEPPKPEKSKKQGRKKSDQPKTGKRGKAASKPDAAAGQEDEKTEGAKKRKTKAKEIPESDKKSKADIKNAKIEKEAMSAVLSLGVSKTPVLGGRENLESIRLAELESMALTRMRTARANAYCVGDFEVAPSPAPCSVRPCLPLADARGSSTLGMALLIGLPHDIGWNLDNFIAANVDDRYHGTNAEQRLTAEYDETGINGNFKACVQGSICVLGRANHRTCQIYAHLLGTALTAGQGVGDLDCHIGGMRGVCSSRAACIRFSTGVFQLCCMNSSDVVTLNGQRITANKGWVELEHCDLCSVGSRVFLFLLPT